MIEATSFNDSNAVRDGDFADRSESKKGVSVNGRYVFRYDEGSVKRLVVEFGGGSRSVVNSDHLWILEGY